MLQLEMVAVLWPGLGWVPLSLLQALVLACHLLLCLHRLQVASLLVRGLEECWQPQLVLVDQAEPLL